MLGAIAGDIIGSVFEFEPIKRTEFPLFDKGCEFTDDTVLTMAVAEAIMTDGDYGRHLHEFGRRYADRGYGGRFLQWLNDDKRRPYNSFGNGSAMRVSPVGFAFDKVDDVLDQARRSAECSHNHPEGIKGAQATALAIYLARTGTSKADIKKEIRDRFRYDLDRRVADIRLTYIFDVTCQGSVPEAVLCFLESESYEEAIRLAISLGGDADTQACIAGGVAEAYYGGVPEHIAVAARDLLTPELRKVLERFETRFRSKPHSAATSLQEGQFGH